ncbi:MAG: SCP2 sterol-binding domain-containing protein [Gammaproteobacteria bacterium]|nr:SCP2 sterol-binding domain-containing protein [Gammaproteobacteria bacterium]
MMLPVPEFVRDTARRAIGMPARVIPYGAQKPLLQRALNQAFREPLQEGELEFLEGHCIRIRINDAGVDWLIAATETGFVALERERPEDVCISGDLWDFTLLATRRADPDTLFFQRRIRIEGDTELGLAVKNTMDGMDWDDLPPPLRHVLRGLGQVIERLAPSSGGAH